VRLFTTSVSVQGKIWVYAHVGPKPSVSALLHGWPCKVDFTLEENGKFGAASKVSIPTRRIIVARAEPHHRVQVLDRAREFQPAVVASQL